MSVIGINKEKIIDRWGECLSCGNRWDQRTTESGVCENCHSNAVVFKFSALTDEHDAAMRDYERIEATGLANEIKRVRGEAAAEERGRRGRRKSFVIPKGML